MAEKALRKKVVHDIDKYIYMQETGAGEIVVSNDLTVYPYLCAVLSPKMARELVAFINEVLPEEETSR